MGKEREPTIGISFFDLFYNSKLLKKILIINIFGVSLELESSFLL